jgi:hypothetical protein
MKTQIICRSNHLKQRAISLIEGLPLQETHEVVIRPYKSKRSLEQNNKMWAMLGDIAKQVVWYDEKLTAEEWKDVITAGVKKQKVVPGIDGGFVIVGAKTSKMTIKEMVEVIEVAGFFGDQQQVKWSAIEGVEQ